MKFILALLLMLAGLANAAAQVRFFANVGIQSSYASEKNESPSWDTDYKPFFTNRSSLHLGLGAEWPIDRNQQFYIQSLLRYSGKGRNFFRSRPEPLAQSTDTLSIKNNVALNYMEFPITINFKKQLNENWTLHAGAGFYGGFLFNGNIHQETRIYSTKKYTRDDLSVESGNAAGKYKTTDWGYIMNLGVEKGKFGFQAFIENGLKSYYQQTGIQSIQHRVIGISLNYFLSTLPKKVTTVIENEKEKDSDSDGIGDSKDTCPFESGSQLTAGCPDTDGDGVADKTDKCPSTKGLAKYQGCPIPDTDQDGIDDEKDSCVNLKGVPSYNGCPPPVLKDTIRKKFESIAAKIFFEYKSDSLKPSSVIELEELSNILLQNPQLILKIEGHTDNAGNQASNLQLSQHRAESVKSFFIQKGIDPSRLNAIGWGQEKPKASNETEEGRKLNRRVELLVEEKNQ